MNLNLISPSGQIKQAPVGFSYTALLFSFLVPALRRDWKWAVLILAIKIIFRFLTRNFGYPPMGLFVNILLGFFYNNLYIQGLLGKGYKPATDLDAEVLRTKVRILD